MEEVSVGQMEMEVPPTMGIVGRLLVEEVCGRMALRVQMDLKAEKRLLTEEMAGCKIVAEPVVLVVVVQADIPVLVVADILVADAVDIVPVANLVVAAAVVVPIMVEPINQMPMVFKVVMGSSF